MNQFYPSQLRTAVTAAIIVVFMPFLLQAQETVSGVLRIKVSESLATRLQQSGIARSASGEIVTGLPSLDHINKQFQVRTMKRVFPDAGKFEARHRKHGLHLWYEVRMNKAIPATSAIQSYQSDRNILRAEPVYQKAITGSGVEGFGPRVIGNKRGGVLTNAPNDPLLGSQWHYNNTGQTGGKAGADVRLFEAWKAETGSPDVIVAVTDGGVQTDHPDLAANMWTNPGEIPGNRIDDDNNGYIDDVHGYGFVNNSGNILPHDHGTHVAGTIAAVSNNAEGVAGVAGGSGNGDGVRIMSCAVFAYDSVPDGFAEAYVYAADNGAIISQNSWGYTLPGMFEHVVLEAIDYFIEEAGKNVSGQQVGPMNGGLAIFSTGNFNDEGNYYPAFYEKVIAVSSTDHLDNRAHYANYGTWVDLSAPGGETDVEEAQGVVSTLPNSQYGAFMGTSMACPHVSGIAALVISKYAKPGLRPEAVRARLQLSVDDIYAVNPSYAGKLGTGRINAALALREGDDSGPNAINNLSIASVDVGSITLTWTSPRDEGDYVAEYDFRYATTPITDANFDDALRITDIPAPQMPGETEQFTVTNLEGGIEFYFAIRSLDFEGNPSPLSNIVSQVSALTPVLSVTPPSIEVDLVTAGQISKTLTIANEGEGPLTFAIDDGDETSFVRTQIEAGRLEPAEETSVPLLMDAARRHAGSYEQDITITTNDPSAPSVKVKIRMNVTANGSPIVRIAPDTVDFRSAQIGQTVFRTIVLTNEGSERLVIHNIQLPNEAFSAQASPPLNIASFQTLNLRIGFSPAVTGDVSTIMTLGTNDPARQELAVYLEGEGLNEAPIAVMPSSFNETLQPGTMVTRQLTLKNNGSEPREFRIATLNPRLVQTESSARLRVTPDEQLTSTEAEARQRRIREHQQKFTTRHGNGHVLAKSLGQDKIANSQKSGRIAPAYRREQRDYLTGFEEFTIGSVGEQHGWYATQGWTIDGENPDMGKRHLRATSAVSGLGETLCISPYLFEYDEFYYPQYTTVSLRVNLAKAGGTTWQIVPQDPWSFVATRLRINPDKTLDALVIGNEYDASWKRVPVSLPSGYFDITLEYNNAGSDTSGFPTYYLFINNQHVFSGTGLASGIGQVAFVSPMETNGPMLDVDDIRLLGYEYVPHFVSATPQEGTLDAGETTTLSVQFDATLLKYGNYESGLVAYIDEVDSLVVPVSLNVPGEGSIFMDPGGIFWALKKNEEGFQEFFLKNDGGKALTFAFEHDIPGMTVTPPSGSLGIREEEVVQFRYKGPPGYYRYQINFRTNIHPDPKPIGVTIIQYDEGAVFSAPDTLDITVTAGQSATETFQLRNTGINTVSYLAESSPTISSVLHITPANATIADTPQDVTVTVDATDLTPQIITGYIRFRTNDEDMPNFYTQVRIHVREEQSDHYLLRDVWTGIAGRDVAVIPLSQPPHRTEPLHNFEAPQNAGDNYGARIRGFVVAPASGNYTFWIASNDFSELWLSTDEREINKRKIAWVSGATNPREWTKFKSQTSQTIYLEGMQRYYIEALHKEGVGTDHLTVAWQTPDGLFEGPIPSENLRPPDTEGSCTASGVITREFWNNVRGTSVSDIPLHRAPDAAHTLDIFEGPADTGINYGARIRGYICPPATGDYTFWIASNDHSELWLSTDDDPANGTLIASLTRATGSREWQRFASQKSVSIRMEKGRRYYIEALHKQGIGSAHIAVGWQLPDGTLERPIAGSRLSPFHTGEDLIVDSQAQIHAFPNPLVGERLNVIISGFAVDREVSRNITIRDLAGVALYTQTLDCTDGCETSFEVRDKLKPGIYVLQVTAEPGRQLVEKLIVE